MANDLPKQVSSELTDEEVDSLVQCQGCGQYRDGHWLGKPHNCHKLPDGTYEEGGTFQ